MFGGINLSEGIEDALYNLADKLDELMWYLKEMMKDA